MLGAGPAGSPAEAEQRLYERSLVAAWREATVFTEAEQTEFLARFEPGGREVAFAVLGGAFGEGEFLLDHWSTKRRVVLKKFEVVVVVIHE